MCDQVRLEILWSARSSKDYAALAEEDERSGVPVDAQGQRPGVGDATRGQLRDIPNVDSLYFTMLNHNKRSVTLNPKSPMGQKIFARLIEECDVMVENFAPGAIDRMGFPWEKIQKINPRMIYASVKGFGPGPYEDCKVYENVAQCTGGSSSTTSTVSPTRNAPASGLSSPMIILANVVLPAPLGPMTPTMPPRGRVNVMSSKRTRSP